MATGNRELDFILERLAAERRGRLKGSDVHRLRQIERVVQSGMMELRRADRLLGELAEELQQRARRPTRPGRR
ncbi:MAG: hypothetical protein GY719_20620 [bacterium]|nr:hypothetical protein [bacterium]